MATKFTIRHRTSKRYLACVPSTAEFLEITPIELAAQTWDFKAVAEIERVHLGEFADAYEVVPVARGES